MPIVDSLVMELEQEGKTTRRVLERVPNDNLAWKPHPKSMSLGQLALHVAQIPGVMAGFVSGPELNFSGDFVQTPASSASEVMTALDASLTKAKDVLRGLDDATVMSSWSFKRDG